MSWPKWNISISKMENNITSILDWEWDIFLESNIGQKSSDYTNKQCVLHKDLADLMVLRPLGVFFKLPLGFM